MQLLPSPDHDFTYSLAGATAADCVLCAVDQTCGLLVSLGLSPVLVLVGIARGPELSSGKKVPAASAAVHSVPGPLLAPPPLPPVVLQGFNVVVLQDFGKCCGIQYACIVTPKV